MIYISPAIINDYNYISPVSINDRWYLSPVSIKDWYLSPVIINDWWYLSPVSINDWYLSPVIIYDYNDTYHLSLLMIDGISHLSVMIDDISHLSLLMIIIISLTWVNLSGIRANSNKVFYLAGDCCKQQTSTLKARAVGSPHQELLGGSQPSPMSSFISNIKRSCSCLTEAYSTGIRYNTY